MAILKPGNYWIDTGAANDMPYFVGAAFSLDPEHTIKGSYGTIIGGSRNTIYGSNVMLIGCNNITEHRDNAFWINNVDLTSCKNAEIIAKTLKEWLENNT